MAKRVYLSPENRKAPHGVYAYGATSEHVVCHEIADLLKAELERLGFECVIADPGTTCAQRIAWANANAVDAYIPLHSNGYDGTVRGFEIMYSNKLAGYPGHIAASKRLCEAIHSEVMAVYSGPDRGVRADYSNFAEIRSVNAPTAYPELGFHDNAADARFIVENKAAIAQALAKGICAFSGVSYTPPSNEAATGEVAQLKAEIARLEDEVRTRERQTAEVGAQLAAAAVEIAGLKERIRRAIEQLTDNK